MSATPIIDDDKITVLIQKVAKKADLLKEEHAETINLLNQLAGISKNKKGELNTSMLTKKEMKSELREIIYKECIEAATRLKIQ